MKSRKQENIEGQSEEIKIPEIIIREENGAQLLSLLLKAENPQWGETETPLAIETAEYFANNPLSPDLIKSVRALLNTSDEETLYNLALTYQHPEREEMVFKMIDKFKPWIKNPKELLQMVLSLLNRFDQIFSSSSLVEKFSAEIRKDKAERISRIDETRQRIGNVIEFYRPDQKTQTQRLIFVPTDPLLKNNTGRNFRVAPDEQIIMSHIQNTDNQDHEFSHGIINPIIEKLSQSLTEEQKDRITELASPTLRQGYGDWHFSLLCEELIRTYIDVFRKGKKPETEEDFVGAVENFDKEDFQKELKQNPELQLRCKELGVTNLDDLKMKSNEYYKRFRNNQLRQIIFDIYVEYSSRADQTENFEQFLMRTFIEKLSNNL